MTNYEIFKNAPIVEAVLDIQVQLPKNTSLEDLKTLGDHVKEHFPEIEERRVFKGGIRLGKETEIVSTTQKKLGYLFRSPQYKKLVQSRLDGFSFNKLKPYEEWKLFRDEARDLWDKYKEIARPTRISRIALRYINRIEVPFPIQDLSEYLQSGPVIPPNIPQDFKRFFTRIEILNNDIEAIAILIQTMEDPTGSDMLPLIVDIDAVKEKDYEGEMEDMWRDFEELHEFKNDVFFNIITEKTKELFR